MDRAAIAPAGTSFAMRPAEMPVIRLTTRQLETLRTEVRIDGRLDLEGVGELESLLTELRGQITLDLSGMTSIDHAGRAALIRIRGAGGLVVGASLYVDRLLEEAQP